MIICQVDAQVLAMGKEDIEQELQVLGEVFAAIGGELIHADFSMGHGYLVAYVCAESELVVNDIFDASYFKVESILYLKPSCVDYPHLNLHQCLSEQNGRLASGLVVPVFTPDFQSRFPPNRHGRDAADAGRLRHGPDAAQATQALRHALYPAAGK